MARDQKIEWARAIIDEATKHNFDPYTMIAIMHGESRLIPGVIGGMDKQCVGLGQTCLHRFRECAEDFSSLGCERHRQRLLHWRNSMSQISADISSWRKYCKKLTGKSALFHRWLAAYQGFNSPRRGIWCGQQKTNGRWRDVPIQGFTRRVMNYRRKLIKERR